MGSVGSTKNDDGTSTFNRANTRKFYDFKDNPALSDAGYLTKAKEWWREHSEYSNLSDWEDNLTEAEEDAIHSWIGFGYDTASKLYNIPWDDLSEGNKEFISNLHSALNKFTLKKGITVNRRTNFKIFGSNKPMGVGQVIDYIKNNTIDGYLQVDGHMSFSTRSNGVSVAGSGLVIHLDVPPNKGGGAYVSTIGGNAGEKEYLTNNNSILKFDPNSVERRADGMIHVNARYVGRAEMQTIDPKNKSKYKKSK